MADQSGRKERNAMYRDLWGEEIGSRPDLAESLTAQALGGDGDGAGAGAGSGETEDRERRREEAMAVQDAVDLAANIYLLLDRLSVAIDISQTTTEAPPRRGRRQKGAAAGH